MVRIPAEFDPRTTPTDSLMGLVARVPWFTNLGGDALDEGDVVRIRGWGEWPGPEDRGSAALFDEVARWRSTLPAAERPKPHDVETLRELIGRRAIELSAGEFEYDPREMDSWDGPFAAVGTAA